MSINDNESQKTLKQDPRIISANVFINPSSCAEFLSMKCALWLSLAECNELSFIFFHPNVAQAKKTFLV